MSAVYTYANLLTNITSGIHGEVLTADALTIINEAAKEVVGDVDLRSCKRKTSLSPFLFSDVYEYSCPTDLKADRIIDIKPQINRDATYEFELTTQEEFDRKKDSETNLFAISDDSFTRKLLISVEVEDSTLIVSQLDSTTSGGGTWSGYGDGTNLTADSDYVVKGSASINWDINADGGTTAGIVNSTLNTFDLTDYVANGAVFVWSYITSTTNLTNFIIRIGSDASNYFTKTVTTTNEGTSFVNGWNLLRFDFGTATQTGTVDLDACDYCAIYMTKAAGKVSETDYRFDYIQVKVGEYHEVIYQSRYPWQSNTGTWIADSTATTDYINADTEELELFTLKGKELVSAHLQNEKDEIKYARKYKEKAEKYKLEHPSEAKILCTSIR